jgi:hypothetical protein
MVAAEPLVLATTMDSILYAAPDEAALDARDVAEVVVKETDEVFPTIDVTLIRFGADIIVSFKIS